MHDTSAFEDEKVTELFLKFGYEGVGLFYVFLEKIGKHEKPVKTSVLKSQLKVGKKLDKCWNFMEEIGLISTNNGETFNKQLLNFSEKFQIKSEKNKIRIAKWRENQALIENVTHSECVRNADKEQLITVNNNKDNILLEKESKENLVDIDKNILEQNLTAEKIDSNPPAPFTTKGQKKEKMKFEPNFDFCENSPLKEVLKRWLKYKEWKGQRYKGQDSIETMFKKLNEYSRGDPGVALEIIEDAIAKNYSGFFKPTNKFTNDTNTKNNKGTDDLICGINASSLAGFLGTSTDELLGRTTNGTR
jgi:hypothetical protein